jgi:hypothetical protein
MFQLRIVHPMFRDPVRYAILMVVQTAAATFLFFTVFPIFRQVVTQFGKPQDISLYQHVAVACGAAVLQACYWARFRRVPIPVPFRSAFVGHLFLFAGRASFFCAGAFFSAFFFRHFPELEQLPPLVEGAAKVFEVILILFSLFCYSLELERLGRAIEDRAPAHHGKG